jgi:hypothetical protein
MSIRFKNFVKTQKKNSKKRKEKKKRGTLKRKTQKKGGEAVAAGGYGCIFKPALSCAESSINKSSSKSNSSKSSKSKTGLISKLLLKENAFSEMEEIERVLKYIKKNPNNSNYFIINDQVSLCAPAPLSSRDLVKYDEICRETRINKTGITQTNINANLDKVNIITMLDGGEDLEKYFIGLAKNPLIHDKFAIFQKINKTLIGLLNNAIVKLNKDGLYHLDIKASNILLGKDGHTRLIDWGTSFEYNQRLKNTGIPRRLFERALFQFNVPFSIILFRDDLNTVIRSNEKDTAKELILSSLKDAGVGHFDYIIEMMIVIYRHILNKPNYTKADAMQMVEDYINAILLKYLDVTSLTFRLEDFFREVMVHNIDVYGFIIAYINLVLIDGSPEKNIQFIEKNKNNKYMTLITEIAMLLHDFCWSPKYAAARIPVNVLTARLHKLNKI